MCTNLCWLISLSQPSFDLRVLVVSCPKQPVTPSPKTRRSLTPLSSSLELAYRV